MSLRRGVPLPASQPFGLLSWLVAASTLLAVLCLAAALGLAGTAAALRTAATGQATVQIVDADPAARARATDRAIAILRDMPGVRSASQVGETAMSALLRPYLGELPLADLPVPTIITVTLAPDADRNAIARGLHGLSSARLDGDAGEGAALDRFLASLRHAAMVGAVIAVFTTWLMTMLATRAAMAAHAKTVEIVHMLGATDAQLSAMLARRMVREAAVGAGIGLLGGIAAIMVLADRLSALGSELGDSAVLGWAQWALLLALPFAIILLAAATAQAAMLLMLRRAP